MKQVVPWDKLYPNIDTSDGICAISLKQYNNHIEDINKTDYRIDIDKENLKFIQLTLC